MQDHIVKAVTAAGTLRAAAALTTSVVQEARDRHDLYPVPTAALGRLLTGGLLLAADFKENERINLRIDGDGPLGHMLVDAGYGEARGYVSNPEAHLPLSSQGKLDVGGAVGKGILYVVKDMGLKEPWQSSVDLISGEIAEDLTYYLTHSEQIPSAIALGVLVNPGAQVEIAGGLLVQVLPGCPEEHLAKAEAKVARISSVTQLLKEMQPKALVEWLLEGLEPVTFAPIPVRYSCKCSRDGMVRALISLGRNDLEELAGDPDGFEIVCRFCNEKYTFRQEEIKDIVGSL